MDVQALEPNKGNMSRALKKALLVLNCILLMLGDNGGPLFLRLYYFRGGHRRWLASWLETGGCPMMLIPLSVSYMYRRRNRKADGIEGTKLLLITPRLLLACVVLGLLIGLDDFLYAFGVSYLPISTSVILSSTQLVFTSFFAFVVVKQKFTVFTINSVGLLSTGAVILGLHTSSDHPPGVSMAQYYMGFFMILSAAALYGFILSLVELTYSKAKKEITYTLVMEMQFVMCFTATCLCTVGMLINRDFQAIPIEAKNFELGETRYYVVLVCCAIFWQFYFLGAVGVIFCASSLLTGIMSALIIPVVEVMAVIFLHEKFTSDKGISLVLALWGLSSYLYGQLREKKRQDSGGLTAAA